MVGRWLAGALDTQAERLAARYGIGVTVVGIANLAYSSLRSGLPGGGVLARLVRLSRSVRLVVP
jgi:hypothetical protein